MLQQGLRISAVGGRGRKPGSVRCSIHAQAKALARHWGVNVYRTSKAIIVERAITAAFPKLDSTPIYRLCDRHVCQVMAGVRMPKLTRLQKFFAFSWAMSVRSLSARIQRGLAGRLSTHGNSLREKRHTPRVAALRGWIQVFIDENTSPTSSQSGRQFLYHVTKAEVPSFAAPAAPDLMT